MGGCGFSRDRERAFHRSFPEGLTESEVFREAGLTNNQCTLAMALLGPLARRLLGGEMAYTNLTTKY